jgi:hypothetical protein
MKLFFDISALLVALSILSAAWMWWMVWRVKFPVPLWDVAHIFSVAFLFQLLIYISFSIILIDIQLRAYLVRTSIIIICLSQAIPLWSVYRSWKNVEHQ